MNSTQVREEMRRRVDRHIRGFEDWYSRDKGAAYVEAEERAILEALDLRPGHAAIDAGCGGGRFTLLMAPRCSRVLATDLSPVAAATTLERAQALGLCNVRTAVADLVDGLPDEAADRILAAGVLPLIPTHEDRRRALEGLRRSLRPGGRLVVTAFNGRRFMDLLRGRGAERIDAQNAENSWFYRYFHSAGELRAALEEAGLREVDVLPAINLPGRTYRWPIARALAPLDRLLGKLPIGRGMGIYLLGTGVRR